jgi:putative ABC transport system substrate-binding protein
MKSPPSVPSLHCMVLDAKRHGLGTLPGVPLDVAPGPQLAGYRRALPAIKKLGVLYDPARSTSFIEEARSAATSASFTLVLRSVDRPERVPEAARAILNEVDALWIIPDPLVAEADAFRFILAEAMKKKVPLLAYSDGFVRTGALLGITPDYRGIGIETARLAEALEQHAPEAELAVRIPPPKLMVNLRTAQMLGITIPPAVMSEVIVP